MVLASVDDIQSLEAAFASVNSPSQTKDEGWLSRAVQGMLLLNVSAALFGSNQASVCMQSGRTITHFSRS